MSTRYTSVWNYLPPLEADAVTQMALDLTLLEKCETAAGTGYIRFYRMAPSAVTIGRNQRWQRVIDEAVCACRGWDWVRRPTGGGALLHHREINYAVALGHGVFGVLGSGSFRDVFGLIVHALAAGLSSMGLSPAVSLGRTDAHVRGIAAQHGLCGLSLTRYEVALPGGKAIAAAQLLRPNGILQHGTVYLRAPDAADRFWPRVSQSGTAPELVQHWADLGPEWGNCPWQGVAARLAEAFARHLDIRLHAGNLEAQDWESIRGRSEGWTAENWHRRR